MMTRSRTQSLPAVAVGADGDVTFRAGEKVVSKTDSRWPPSDVDWQSVVGAAKALSFADIVKACEDAAKEAILGAHEILDKVLVATAEMGFIAAV